MRFDSNCYRHSRVTGSASDFATRAWHPSHADGNAESWQRARQAAMSISRRRLLGTALAAGVCRPRYAPRPRGHNAWSPERARWR